MQGNNGGNHRHHVIMKDGKEQIGGDSAMVMPPAVTRKGPWTDEEGAAGLKRTGKGCRLRWVNYLHPGLRRGRITADEERLILELHAQWGSRWSRIARSLPGRTDNEIKNFWRTRTRKKALEQRRQMNNDNKMTAAVVSPSYSSSVTSGISSSSSPVTESAAMQERSSGGDNEAELEEATVTTAVSHHQQQQTQEHEHGYTMDQLWNEMAAEGYVTDSWGPGHHRGAAVELPSMASPVWEFCSDYSLWRIDDKEYCKNMLGAS